MASVFPNDILPYPWLPFSLQMILFMFILQTSEGPTITDARKILPNLDPSAYFGT